MKFRQEGVFMTGGFPSTSRFLSQKRRPTVGRAKKPPIQIAETRGERMRVYRRIRHLEFSIGRSLSRLTGVAECLTISFHKATSMCCPDIAQMKGNVQVDMSFIKLICHIASVSVQIASICPLVQRFPWFSSVW
jgi:hypothetical protein